MSNNQEDRDTIDIQQYWLILKRRWLLISLVAGSVFGITALITFKQAPIYEAEAKLRFNKQNSTSQLTGISESVGELSGITNLSNPIDTEAEIIRSYPVIQKAIDDLSLKGEDNQPLSVDDLLKSLKLKTIRGTDIMQISYRSTDPQEAARIVNTIIKYYLESNITNNRSEIRSAREFLTKQLPDVEKKVLRAEMALRLFKEKNRVVALQEEAKAGVENLSKLSNDIIKAQADWVGVNTRTVSLQNQMQLSTQEAIQLSTLSQTPSVQQILAEYQKAENELAIARTRLTNEHPTLINLEKKAFVLREKLQEQVAKTTGNTTSLPDKNLQIGELKQSLTVDLVKAEVERTALANRVNQLKQAFAQYQNRLDILPRLEQEQLQLERQLQIARLTYEQLLKTLQEVEVAENQNVGNARIIAQALMPKEPVSPRILLNLLLGGFVGIILGIGTAFILESMDKALKTVEEAKQLLGYPLLAAIPAARRKGKEKEDDNAKELPVINSPYSTQTAAFEMLQTNLGFTLSDKTLKVIVITSSVPSEGKSFVSANLAAAASQMGRRVLLIDADMRRPRQQEVWQIQNFQGLSNVLVGQSELEYVTQEVQVNLDLLTAGTVPPNPAALLDSNRMSTLVEEVSNKYDFVIIDTPPIGLFADAVILGKLADGMMLVVRPGTVTSPVVATSKSTLEQSGRKVLGMVVNGVKSEGRTGYYSYSYHGYYRKYYGQGRSDNNGKAKVEAGRNGRN
jgi:succinoglycan biosynthesis transport protein ExoP